MTKISNVRVKFIRKNGFNNLKEWMEDEKNLYIGRKNSVIIDGSRFPSNSSKWCNPFKASKGYNLEQSLEKYENHIRDKIKNEPNKYNIEELIGKNLGCWCKPNSCHGDILLKIINEKNKINLNLNNLNNLNNI